jgi:hypothetical protein
MIFSRRQQQYQYQRQAGSDTAEGHQEPAAVDATTVAANIEQAAVQQKQQHQQLLQCSADSNAAAALFSRQPWQC